MEDDFEDRDDPIDFDLSDGDESDDDEEDFTRSN
jgi:hypothetical protein